MPPPEPDVWHLALAILLAFAGGAFGIIGAFFVEVRSGVSPLLLIVGAPIAEELVKPCGVYVLIARWPFAVRRQIEIALLTSLSGLVFGLLESLTYVSIYAPHHSDAYLLFRFTFPPAVHVVASFTAGWGVNQRLLEWAVTGTAFPRRSRNAFVAAMLIHAVYNTTVAVLALTGTLRFR